MIIYDQYLDWLVIHRYGCLDSREGSRAALCVQHPMKLPARICICIRRQLIMVTQRKNAIAWLDSHNLTEKQGNVILPMLILISTKGGYQIIYLNVL